MNKIFSCFVVLASLPFVAGCGSNTNQQQTPATNTTAALHDTITRAASQESLRSVLNAGKPVVIKFSAQWCGPCRRMQPIFEDLSKEFADKYAFVEVDIDAAASLTDEYNVKGVPTIVIIKDGKEVGRQVGAQSKDALKNTIQNALGK